jgi:cyclopropane fatty-acyl-phospholipid synthase-like methyltransferase
MGCRDEQWALENFTNRYLASIAGAAADVERQVIGAAWGVNGYTTRDQADALGDRLGLGPTSRLLDLGAGRGWPGLYLASRHSCAVVLTDLPHGGLAMALHTARERRLDARPSAVVASARRLPFRAGYFDAVVHADVLCCLAGKLAVLQATRRMLRPGGRTAFFTIYVPNELSPALRRWALSAAPRYGWSRAAHVQLMRSAGFVDIEEVDATNEYLDTLRGWYERSAEREDELVGLWGAELFVDRQRDRHNAMEAVEAGVQRRVLITGTRPAATRRRGVS